MNPELEALLTAAETGDIDDTQRTRLNQLLREDDAALDAAAEQLDLDALLRWHHGTVGTGVTATAATAPATADQPAAMPISLAPIRWMPRLVAAAAVLLAIAGLYWWATNSAPTSDIHALSIGRAKPATGSSNQQRIARNAGLVIGVRLCVPFPDGTLQETDHAA